MKEAKAGKRTVLTTVWEVAARALLVVARGVEVAGVGEVVGMEKDKVEVEVVEGKAVGAMAIETVVMAKVATVKEEAKADEKTVVVTTGWEVAVRALSVEAGGVKVVEAEEAAKEAGAASANHATVPLLHPHMHGACCKAAAPASRASGKRTAAPLASGTARRDERHVGAASASVAASAADETRRYEIVRDILHTHARAHATGTMHAHRCV